MSEPLNNPEKKCIACSGPMTDTNSCPVTAMGKHYEVFSPIQAIVNQGGALHG